jgi:TetR/AcrR family transcriptional regulator, cholesterol catabolism regulator
VFWRKLAAAPLADHASDDGASRVIDVLRHIALLVADDPEFAGAVTSALLGRDPDVEVLRLRIGRDIHDRLVAALGSDRDPDVIESLELLLAGAPDAENGDRTRHRGIDDIPDVGAVLDRQGAQLPQAAEQ